MHGPKLLILLMLLSILNASTVLAQQLPVEAAKTVMVKGSAYAQTLDGEKKPLQRRSPIYVGETLVTGEDTILQIRFTDRALMTLRENTIFYIEEYVPADEKKGGKALMQLLAGGFRTMTGIIGKDSADEYSVKTNAASIGIRGTFYDAVVLENDSLSLATWEGEVMVSNESGALAIGPFQAHQYASITPNRAPEGSLMPPQGITAPDEYKKPVRKVSPEKSVEKTEDRASQDEKSKESTDGDKPQSMHAEKSTSQSDTAQTKPAARSGGPNLLVAPKTPMKNGLFPNPPVSPMNTSREGIPPENGLDVESLGEVSASYFSRDQPPPLFFDFGDTLAIFGLPQEIGNTQTITDNLIESSITEKLNEAPLFLDGRLTQAERDQIGATARLALVTQLVSSTTQPINAHLDHAVAVFTPDNNPVFLVKASGGSDRLIDPQSTQTVSYELYRQGAASKTEVNENVDGLGAVGWGIWDGTTSSGGVTQYTPPNTTPVEKAIGLLWVTALPQIDTPMTGTVSFTADETSPFIAQSSLGQVGGIRANFNIDFDKALMADGSQLTVSLDKNKIEQFWQVILDGQLLNYDKGQFSLQLDPATTASEAYLNSTQSCSDCIAGSIDGIIVRGGESVVSTFALEAKNPDTNAVENTHGAVLLSK